MAYTKHTWVNESEPAINADHLNEMEDGIEIGVGKQDKITANGILKGNGSGAISAATAGTDYMKSMKISGSGNYISNIEQSNGVITATKANLPTASATTLGMVKVDGTTITINNGTISSSGGTSGSTYTVQVKSNHTNATITYCWKIGKMITFYGQFNDGLNGGSNFVNVASADTISHGYIQSGDNVMAFGNIHDNYATFDVEVGATTSGSAFNGRNFVGVIWLS